MLERDAMQDYVLEIVEGPETGRQIPVTRRIEIGRDKTTDVPLFQDELVSRRHVKLTPEADGVRVEDLASRNGTFVDGDQIFGSAHLAAGGQLLIGVTLFQLAPAAEAAAGRTSVLRIPAGLTALRPLPAAADVPPAVTALQHVPTLETAEAEPDFVPESALASDTSTNLLSLLDSHTKSKARGAPIGMFVLASLAVMLYFALR
jgi:pSer/pThr/pTyr-binding forkhead associated (FHA) protein